MTKISEVLEKLITTEKSTKAKEGQNRYTFRVRNGASQGSVKNEVSRVYKMEAVNVNLMIVAGKKRRLSKTSRFIRLPKWKKAIVTLKEGQKIEESKEKK